MRTILFANQKGGVGKSTLAAALIAHLVDNGLGVAALDLDPQQTLADFIAGSDIDVGLSPLSDVAATKRAAAEGGADVLVIDTGRSVTGDQQQALLAADVAIVPVKASVADMRATARWVRQMTLPPHLFVIGQARSTGNVSAAQEELASTGRLASTTVGLREAYVDLIGGDVAAFQKNQKARLEISALWQEITALGGKADG